VRPRSRRNAKKANASQRRGIPQGDFTLKSGEGVPPVAIVRPTWEDGSMTFRPLPAWNPELASEGQWELDPYRFSQTELDLSDIYRKYPACYYVGQGDETLTMLLYDPAWDETEYNRKGNPYIALWNAVYRAVKRDFTHPEWLRMVEGKKSVLSRPCDLYFFQGLIFKRGADLFVGRGRSPKGLGQKDWSQIIQLKNSAGSTLISLLNTINPDWDGDENDFDKSMIAGDPVSPEHGRFFTIYNPKKEQLGGEDVGEMDSYEVGADGGVESADSDDIKGYRSRIDDCLMLNGRRTKIHARLEGPALEVAKSRIVFFDDIINLPRDPSDDAIDEMHAEQALRLARVLRGHRKMLEFGWHDHPEFFTADVKKVLASAQQVSMSGASKDEEEDLYETPEAVESVTLGADVESEFAESEHLDAAAEYEEVTGEAGEYNDDPDSEGGVAEAGSEEYAEAGAEEYTEAGAEEYEPVEIEDAVAEEYVDETGEALDEDAEYEYVEVPEGEELPTDTEYEDEDPEAATGDSLDDEEEEARQALAQAEQRSRVRNAKPAATAGEAVPPRKPAVRKR